MSVSNVEVAKALETIAILLELESANQFRVRAYQTAARIVETLPKPVTEIEDLSEYFGIGKDLAGKIKDFIETGHIPLLDELASHHPKGIIDLTRLQNLGPKRIKLLNEKLNICSPQDLLKACKKELIRTVKGFGEKTEKKLLDEVNALLNRGDEKRLLWQHVDQLAKDLVSYLEEIPEATRVIVSGSYRRRKETVGDLDILVTTKNPKKMVSHFIQYDRMKEVISKGATRSAIILKNGLRVDLRVLKEESFGSGLYYFTGSKAHNIAVRAIARKRGLKINEYGVYRGTRRIAGRTEEEIFKVLKMDYIPPELRENRGEIEAAIEHRLPKLISVEDLLGDLHMHTVVTDGKNSLEEMAIAAKKLGRKYIANTEHSQNLAMTGGLTAAGLKKHIKEIERVNAKISGITILKGIEVDILEKGSLDLPDSVLKELDVRVCSIHSYFKLSKEKMTYRILKAMDNPYCNIIGHLTGRLIMKRDGVELDLEKIIRHAVERNIAFEINSQPDRLDMRSEQCQMAQELGAKFVISSDAHSLSELRYLELGAAEARRGWVEKKNVLNTLTWNKLAKIFAK